MKLTCEICESEFECESYSDAPCSCGAFYQYNEGQSIILTPEMIQVLRMHWLKSKEKTFGVLVAQMFNSPEVPCLVFSSVENGMNYCNKLFGFSPETLREGEEEEIVGYRWAIVTDDEEENYITDSNSIIGKVAKKLFVDCIGVFAFDLIEVEEGKSFLREFN